MRIILLLLLMLNTAAARADEHSLVLGIHPYLPANELVQRFTPLADYLEARLGRKVYIHIARDYQAHNDAIRLGKLDLAFIGPANYISLSRNNVAYPLAARLAFRGKDRFRGVIITRVDSDIRRLADINNRSFAFGDPMSTLSSRVPLALLQQAGITLDDLSSHTHLDNHNNVALGVLMGRYDVGAVKEEVFIRYRERGLRAIRYTPWFASHLFIMNRELSDRLQSGIRQALFELHEQAGARQVLEGIKPGTQRLIPASDDDYDALRAILALIEDVS